MIETVARLVYDIVRAGGRKTFCYEKEMEGWKSRCEVLKTGEFGEEKDLDEFKFEHKRCARREGN